MQRNRALLREIENTNQPSFIPADVLRVHKSIAQEIKFKATNQNTHDIDSAMNSMHNTHRYYCKKTGYLYGFRHGECHERKL